MDSIFSLDELEVLAHKAETIPGFCTPKQTASYTAQLKEARNNGSGQQGQLQPQVTAPTTKSIDLDAIPQRLKDLARWVGGNYPDKVPLNPSTGRNASSTDPATWGTLPQVLAAQKRYSFDLIGVTLVTDGSGRYIIGIDLDHCASNGILQPWAQEIIDTLASYTEYSPSYIRTPGDHGVRIIIEGDIPKAMVAYKGNPADWPTDPDLQLDGVPLPPRCPEMYQDGRWVTLTGCHVEGTPQTIEYRPDAILTIHSQAQAAIAEHKAIVTAARRPQYSKKTAPRPTDRTGGGNPWDDYNERGPSPTEMLERHNWTAHSEHGDEIRYTRPRKKTSAGLSAQWNAEKRVFYNFSGNSPVFNVEGYNLFQMYTLLEWGGDSKEATKALFAAGYGDQEWKPEAEQPPIDLTQEAPPVEGDDAAGADPPGGDVAGSDGKRKQKPKDSPVEYCSADAIAEYFGDVQWSWKGYIPKGHITMIAAEQGLGKTYLSCRVAGSLTGCLTTWPDGSPVTDSGPVLFVETEQMRGEVVKRLDGMGVSRERYFFGPGNETNVPDLVKDAPTIEQLAREQKVGAIIIDSLSGGHSLKENSAQMRRLLGYYTGLAARLRIPVIVVHHANKKHPLEKGNITLNRIRGSSTITQFCRSVIGLWRLDGGGQNDPVRMEVIKANFCKAPDPIGFTVCDTGLVFHDAPEEEKAETQTDKARRMLETILNSGPLESAEVEDTARGWGVSMATVNRVKGKLGVVSKKDGTVWKWSLPYVM